MTQLTKLQIEKQDIVDNYIYEVLLNFARMESGNDRYELDWDIEEISDVREVVMDILIKHGLTTEMKFYPYMEE